MISSLRMIEFFSGIGGMRFAVEEALQGSGIQLAFVQAWDISLHANETYKYNFPGESVRTKLVEQLKPDDLDGKADLWTMSPPCQPFTDTKGAKSLDIDDKRCHGLKAIVHLLNRIEKKPKFIVLENVKGFATSEMCRVWQRCLRQNQYQIQEYILSPVQFGIPNHRRRYYMLCEFKGNGWDLAQDENKIIQTQLPLGSKLLPPRTVAEFIENNIPDLQPFLINEDVLGKPWAKTQLGIVAPGDSATHCFTAGYSRILGKATGSVLLLPPTNNHKMSQEYTSWAIAKNPIDRSDMLQYKGRLRRFTPTELLAIFGFPKSFRFPPTVGFENQYKLIGNSINITIVAMLLNHLLFENNNNQRDNQMGSDRLLPGGERGHCKEIITGNLLRLYRAFRWKPLSNCTGRYTCRDHKLVSLLDPLQLLGSAGIQSLENCDPNDSLPETSVKMYSFQLPKRADRVWVVPLDVCNQTGVITFEKQQSYDGNSTYVHTVNAPSGFRRKLHAIGINVTDDAISAANIVSVNDTC